MASKADIVYRRVLRPLLFRLDAEAAHRLALAFMSAVPPAFAPVDPPELGSRLWGLEFSNPVGLAAGMDKDARAAGAWQALGFGFVELGTVTPRPQPGNPRPRLWRLCAEDALVNSLGFPSRGMEAVGRRLERLRRRGLRLRLGINLGPNRETAAKDALADYVRLMERLGPLADFVVLNVSSPNTPGLRNWQAPGRIREVASAASRAAPALKLRRPPILIKIAPDLEAPELVSLCGAAIDAGLDGIVACNTTLNRSIAGLPAGVSGGLSGRPLRERSRQVIGAIRRHTGGKLPIIGVGGIANAEDAWSHILAGANLVELYTGLVYQGPSLVRSIKAGLCGLLSRAGLRSIGEAVGAGL